MRKGHIFEDLKDWHNKTHILAEGFLAACQIYGFPAPYSLELQPDTATAWVAAQIINYYTKLDEQMRANARHIVDVLGVTPDYVKDLLSATEPEVQPANTTAPVPGDGENQTIEQSVPETAGTPGEAPEPQQTVEPANPVVRNSNPQLNLIMNLFRQGAFFLGTIPHEERRELAKMLLVADRDLGHAPFWNDIEGFADPYGHQIQELNTSPSQNAHATSVELKRQYLSSVVIPECLRILADYIRREVCASAQMDNAVQVQHFLDAF